MKTNLKKLLYSGVTLMSLGVLASSMFIYFKFNDYFKLSSN